MALWHSCQGLGRIHECTLKEVHTNSMFEMFVRILQVPGSKGYIEISYIHMYTHTCMYIHVLVHTYMFTYTCTYIHTCI